jgi:hypothetical protein
LLSNYDPFFNITFIRRSSRNQNQFKQHKKIQKWFNKKKQTLEKIGDKFTEMVDYRDKLVCEYLPFKDIWLKNLMIWWVSRFRLFPKIITYGIFLPRVIVASYLFYEVCLKNEFRYLKYIIFILLIPFILNLLNSLITIYCKFTIKALEQYFSQNIDNSIIINPKFEPGTLGYVYAELNLDYFYYLSFIADCCSFFKEFKKESYSKKYWSITHLTLVLTSSLSFLLYRLSASGWLF